MNAQYYNDTTGNQIMSSFYGVMMYISVMDVDFSNGSGLVWQMQQLICTLCSFKRNSSIVMLICLKKFFSSLLFLTNFDCSAFFLCCLYLQIALVCQKDHPSPSKSVI